MSGHSPIVVFALIVFAVVCLVGLVRPFIGLLAFMIIHFVQPAELVPALAPLRIEFVYAVLLSGAIIVRQSQLGFREIFSNSIVRASFLLIGAAAFTIPFAIYKGGALNGTILLAKCVAALVFIVMLVNTQSRLRQLLWLVVGLLAWFSLSGFIAYQWGDYYTVGGFKRAWGITSLVAWPNELSGMILVLFPFLIVLLYTTKNLVARLALILCGGLAIWTNLLTGSRAGLLAFIGIGFYYVYRSNHRVRALVLLSVLCCSLWFGMPQAYRQRYLTLQSYAEGGKLDPSNELRLAIWRAGWRMFLDHPILGVGANQFPTAYGLIYSGVAHGTWYNPHDLFLQVVCELGIVGLLVFGYFVSKIVKAMRIVLRTRGDPRFALNYHLAVACWAMFLGELVISTVGHTLYKPDWYLLGGIVAANLQLVARSKERSRSKVVVKDEYETATVPAEAIILDS